MATYEGRKRAIVLIGMSGAGKSHWAARYGDKSNWQNMQTVARDELRESSKFLYVSADEEIANRLAQQLIDAGVDKNKQPVDMLAEFVGKFGGTKFQGRYKGLGKDEFLKRQRIYRDAELADLRNLPIFLKSAYGKEPPLPQSIVYDTTGSFCEVLTKASPLYEEITAYATIVYLKCSQQEEDILLQRQLERPKPMVYDRVFFDNCLRDYKEASGRSDDDILPDSFLQFLFPSAVAHRRALYEDLRQVTVTTADLEEIYDEGSPDKFASDFIDLVQENYNQQRDEVG